MKIRKHKLGPTNLLTREGARDAYTFKKLESFFSDVYSSNHGRGQFGKCKIFSFVMVDFMMVDFMMVDFMMVDFMMVVLDLCFPTKTLLTQCVLKETEIVVFV